MKIGLLAVSNHNYGSVLQTYALQNKLETLGYEAEILKYKKTNYYKQFLRLFNRKLLSATIKWQMKKVKVKFGNAQIQEVVRTRHDEFDKFIKKNLKFSKPLIGRGALVSGCDIYDIFVLGSDQVWNPMNLGGDYFTMTFIPEAKWKITYAPSFGVNSIPEWQKKKTRDYLDRIDCISVREVSGQKIIKELTGRDVEVVVDPTLLVGRELWDMIKGDRLIKDDYILCYFISDIEEHRQYAIAMAKELGMKLVTMPHLDEYLKLDEEFADEYPVNIGPSQFVNLISCASYVCTDSFHGTLFSLMYNKEFYTFNRSRTNKAGSLNTRMHTILSHVNLSHRLYDSSEGYKGLDKNIDYSVVNTLLDHIVTSSENYLMSALEGGGGNK